MQEAPSPVSAAPWPVVGSALTQDRDPCRCRGTRSDLAPWGMTTDVWPGGVASLLSFLI